MNPKCLALASILVPVVVACNGAHERRPVSSPEVAIDAPADPAPAPTEPKPTEDGVPTLVASATPRDDAAPAPGGDARARFLAYSKIIGTDVPDWSNGAAATLLLENEGVLSAMVVESHEQVKTVAGVYAITMLGKAGWLAIVLREFKPGKFACGRDFTVVLAGPGDFSGADPKNLSTAAGDCTGEIIDTQKPGNVIIVFSGNLVSHDKTRTMHIEDAGMYVVRPPRGPVPRRVAAGSHVRLPR